MTDTDLRHSLTQTRRWVIKIGSALLTDDGRGLNTALMAGWVESMASLRLQGIEIVLVSSGAVAAGMTRLGWTRRPEAVHELQAAAAVGQMGLVQSWEASFQAHDLHTAQILLVHDDLSHRQRYLNARSTLKTLLGLGVVPVVNENDTVVTDEIRFGDNDKLAALVANLVDADLLVILTDQQGLFDADPRKNADANLIDVARANDSRLDDFAGDSKGELGRGGMATKLQAARLAARSGAHTVIAGGKNSDVLKAIAAGESVGSLLTASQAPVAARKQWLAGHLQIRGELELDDGAVRVLRDSGRSLLSVGICRVAGNFERGEMVSCVDSSGAEVARGLVNYSATDTSMIMGKPSDQIHAILGYQDEDELIHRDNLVLV
ncbi:MAG: glutamate 5-kinase [Pseudomonadales bacterium]